MCFTASASFAAATVLMPVGVFCLYKAHKIHQHYWPFALYPLIFGIQQAVEGVLWLLLDTANDELIRIVALSFVFFSHLFWLFWIPFSCYMIEAGGRKQLLYLFMLFGGMFGLSMYMPVLLFADWLMVSLIHHSISYELRLIFDGFVPRPLVRGVYVLIILMPLLLSSQRYIRYFGMIISMSVMVAVLLFEQTFISVWCFFAAFLSLYILYMFICLEKQTAVRY